MLLLQLSQIVFFLSEIEPQSEHTGHRLIDIFRASLQSFSIALDGLIIQAWTARQNQGQDALQLEQGSHTDCPSRPTSCGYSVDHRICLDGSVHLPSYKTVGILEW